MKSSQKQIKQRYFNKIYTNADTVPCACGCGRLIKNKDRYGRDKHFVSGHNGRKFKDHNQYKREWNHRNRTQRYSYKTKRIKADLILLCGGRCSCCGIPFTEDECVSMFEFHHNDPSAKSFNINAANLNRKSINEIHSELEKCTLVCANCHRLIHWEWDR